MNRMLRFLGLGIASTLLLPIAAFAAKPISVYESMVVPLPRKYANQGFFYGLHLGAVRADGLDFYPEIDGMEKIDESKNLPQTYADLDIGRLIGATVGFRYERWRPELELSWYDSKIRTILNPPDNFSSSSIDTGDFRVIAVMANVYWDFHWTNGINPFIGAGIGFGITNYNATIVHDLPITSWLSGTPGPADAVPLGQSAFNLAYQAMAGVGYMFTDHFEADILAKYFRTKLDSFVVDKGNILEAYEVKFDPRVYNAIVFQLEFRYVP